MQSVSSYNACACGAQYSSHTSHPSWRAANTNTHTKTQNTDKAKILILKRFLRSAAHKPCLLKPWHVAKHKPDDIRVLRTKHVKACILNCVHTYMHLQVSRYTAHYTNALCFCTCKDRYVCLSRAPLVLAVGKMRKPRLYSHRSAQTQ